RAGRRAMPYASNRHTVSIELMILVIAALSRAEVGEVPNKLDRRDPLDHLEAQLVLTPQPQRRAMEDAHRRPVHFVGENGQSMPHVAKLVNVVIAAARRTFGKRVEHRVT